MALTATELARRNALWDEFLEAWPIEDLAEMTLEQYSNDQRTGLVYWLEKKLEDLGSIWGGSAFKFGVYSRKDTATKEAAAGRQWGERYAWATKYGDTEANAFAKVRAMVVEVAERARAADLERIEAIDLAPVLKWKVAFLYQDPGDPRIFPIFKKEALFAHYRQGVDTAAKLSSTPYHTMYRTLLDRNPGSNVFDIAADLWKSYESKPTISRRAWAVPVDRLVEAGAIEVLCGATRIESAEVPQPLADALAAVELAEGDRLVMVSDNAVRALAKVTAADRAELSWDQKPVTITMLLPALVEPRLLTGEELDELESRLSTSEEGADGPRYWKLAPGRQALGWGEWQERGIATIGWHQLGDIAGLSHDAFLARVEHIYGGTHPRNGCHQVWRFRGIRPGDRIIANQGTQRVLGIGTVLEGYRYRPGEVVFDGSDQPHQLVVRWDDIAARGVEMNGWRQTLGELTSNDFGKLAEAPIVKAGQPSSPPPDAPKTPCAPQNIILTGPPGTGKTFNTIKRALELVVGVETVRGWKRDTQVDEFRQRQASGQIELVTFHQAYGYEEFVEGIRPVLGAVSEASVRYELHDGVFKRIALRAAAAGLKRQSDDRSKDEAQFDVVFEALLQLLAREGSLVRQGQQGYDYQLEASTRGSIVVERVELDGEGALIEATGRRQTASRDSARVLWRARGKLGPVDGWSYKAAKAVFAEARGIGGGHPYTALWITIKLMEELARSPGLAPDRATSVARTTVQQALDKQSAAVFEFTGSTPQYVLIIDEINRGNVSRVLGELITLLEPDKRLTAENELRLPLLYSSGHRFAVPPNLHLVGTMNSADRSIAIMDVALRRRFDFEEVMPDAGVIRDKLIEKKVALPLVNLVADLLDILNARIRAVYDRDHQLGHALFLGVDSIGALRTVMRRRVLPLLQEYFYGAWDKICFVLGCPYDEDGHAKRELAHVVSGSPRKYLWPLVSASPSRASYHDDERTAFDFESSTLLVDGADEELVEGLVAVLDLKAIEHSQRVAELLLTSSSKT